jgi:thiol-disulfide isomerase/thioredoxin
VHAEYLSVETKTLATSGRIRAFAPGYPPLVLQFHPALHSRLRAAAPMATLNKKSWKWRFASFGLGLFPCALVFGLALAVSDDLRLMYVAGAIALFSGATWLGRKSRRDWLSVCLLYLPLAGMFWFFVLQQLPFLWPTLVFWVLALVLGLSLSAIRPALRLGGACILLLLSAAYCLAYIPAQMKKATNRFSAGAAPAFTFQAVSAGAVPVALTPGKVLLIDFFGTWCPPCRAELPEIERVRSDLNGREDIQFVVVATNSGGDTPERLRAFAQRNHVTLPLAYDAGGKTHAAFGLSGYPGLVVIDRTGHVRLTREGYNSSETTFRSDLTQLLKSL